MNTVVLGKSGVRVSRLCFGTLTLSPLQQNLSAEEGANLMIAAYEQGVTTFDTAELYDNYAHLRGLLAVHPNAVILSKCYAYDREGAKTSLYRALDALKRDYLDVMMLHEQESEHTLRGHAEALAFFFEMKQKGLLRGVGVSTHFVRCVRAAAAMPELDVIEAMVNQGGFGIVDGTMEEMAQALMMARAAGKGIVAMKPLAGGHYCKSAKQAIQFVLQQPYLDTIALGMQNRHELAYNLAMFQGREPLHEVVQSRTMHVADWCIGCGKCAARCKQHAIVVCGGKAVIDMEKCIMCGYCASTCPEFCIKVY